MNNLPLGILVCGSFLGVFSLLFWLVRGFFPKDDDCSCSCTDEEIEAVLDEIDREDQPNQNH